ncbi:MAG: hypothetical protein K6T66_09475 [Peptococcaceae bacterium]|nr:hypothetical protein [Peptococcaceae bacterium]
MKRCKKFLSILLVVAVAAGLVLSGPPVHSQAGATSPDAGQRGLIAADIPSEHGVTIHIDGELLACDVPPLIEEGRTLVPLRALFNNIGAQVEWEEETRTVTAVKGDLTVRVTVGSSLAHVSDKPVALDVPAKIVNGRTLIPVRFVSESLGARVTWDGAKRLVSVATAAFIAKESEKIAGEKPTEELAEKPATTPSGGGGAPLPQKELVLGTLSPLDPLNLFSSDGAWERICSTGFSHLHLVRFDPDLNVIPCVAERWEVSPDGKSIKFFLNKNVKWHDGQEVTAEDVKFTFEYKLKHLVGTDMCTAEPFFKDAAVVDKYTVVLNLKEPVVMMLLKELAIGYLIPKHIWENVNEPLKYTDKRNMIGCGPYIFEDYDRAAQTATFRANHNYFQGRPSVETVKIKYFKNFDHVVLALKKGEIDAVSDYSMPVPGSYAPALASDKNINLGETPGLQVPAYLGFSFKNHPTKEKVFREAVSYAINYENIVRSICGKYGEVPGKGLIPPSMPGFYPSVSKLEYNPQKARQLLASLNIKEPVYVLPQTRPGKEEIMVRVAEMICGQLKEVGIDARIDQEVIGNYSKWKEKAWKERDFSILVGHMTVFGVLGDAGGSYLIDYPGGYGTCADQKYVEAYEKVIYAKDNSEMKEGVKEMQYYHARELPGIALAWDTVLYPFRTDKFDGWIMQRGLGPVCYHTLFNLKQK